MQPWPHLARLLAFLPAQFRGVGFNRVGGARGPALAGETGFTVRRKEVVFEVDTRPRVAPKVDAFPR